MHTELSAPIAAVTGTGTIIVAAPGVGARIVILGWSLSAASDTTMQWYSDANVIPFSSVISVPVSPDTAYAQSNSGFLCCDVNESLRLVAGAAVTGSVTYAII